MMVGKFQSKFKHFNKIITRTDNVDFYYLAGYSSTVLLSRQLIVWEEGKGR